MIRTYLDANVLIAFIRGLPEVTIRVQELLDDTNRIFVTSPVLAMELFPQAIINNRQEEVAFYHFYFSNAQSQPVSDDLFYRAQQRMIKLRGLQIIDSLHLEAAITAGAREFVTGEKETKPIHRETDITVFRL